MLKTPLLLLILACNTPSLFAQKDTTDNYVNRFLSIPAFKINLAPDSTLFSNENLKKNTPFILMFFSPDCDHCQIETKEILAYKAELKDIQILMVSSAGFREIIDFNKDYGLSAIPNIKVGQDINLRLTGIYSIRSYPSIFVYDYKGVLAKAFVGNIGIPAILDAVK